MKEKIYFSPAILNMSGFPWGWPKILIKKEANQRSALLTKGNQKISDRGSAEQENLWSEESQILSTWVKETQQGSQEAFTQIYNYLKNRLFSLAYRYTYNREAAEDILQETFIKIFSKLSTINKTETFIPWVYRVTINTALSYLRQQKKHFQAQVSAEASELEVQDVPGVESLSQREDQLHQAIEAALRTLPPKLKTVFLLHDVQGFTHEEIAAILGWRVGTSKSQLFKARLKIRDFLKQKRIN